jgi:hypothetical protein
LAEKQKNNKIKSTTIQINHLQQQNKQNILKNNHNHIDKQIEHENNDEIRKEQKQTKTKFKSTVSFSNENCNLQVLQVTISSVKVLHKCLIFN